MIAVGGQEAALAAPVNSRTRGVARDGHVYEGRRFEMWRSRLGTQFILCEHLSNTRHVSLGFGSLARIAWEGSTASQKCRIHTNPRCHSDAAALQTLSRSRVPFARALCSADVKGRSRHSRERNDGSSTRRRSAIARRIFVPVDRRSAVFHLGVERTWRALRFLACGTVGTPSATSHSRDPRGLTWRGWPQPASMSAVQWSKRC